MNQVTIKNELLSLSVLDYGGLIQELWVPNKQGGRTNVVVGFEDAEAYLEDPYFKGACVGRYAGRISGKGFSLEGKFYPLYSENGIHLHGGKRGFGKRFWIIKRMPEPSDHCITLSYKSAHLEEGYPGNLSIDLSYELVENALHINYRAETDQPTVVNLTNHSYFHLDDSNTISEHYLQLKSRKRLETHPNLLPTGVLLDNEGGPYDFLKPSKIGSTYMDTPFTIEAEDGPLAQLYSENSGIRMSVYSNQPAVVVFTPKEFPGICFETQNYPDAPNITKFPNCILNPGQIYEHKTIFEFDLVP